MSQWTISNRTSGVTLGVYDGDTEQAALDAMARDAGYRDHAAACEVAPVAENELSVVEVEPASCSWHVMAATHPCKECGKILLCGGCNASGAYCESCRGDE